MKQTNPKITVRLNLEDADDRRAWERLQKLDRTLYEAVFISVSATYGNAKFEP